MLTRELDLAKQAREQFTTDERKRRDMQQQLAQLTEQCQQIGEELSEERQNLQHVQALLAEEAGKRRTMENELQSSRAQLQVTASALEREKQERERVDKVRLASSVGSAARTSLSSASCSSHRAPPVNHRKRSTNSRTEVQYIRLHLFRLSGMPRRICRMRWALAQSRQSRAWLTRCLHLARLFFPFRRWHRTSLSPAT